MWWGRCNSPVSLFSTYASLSIASWDLLIPRLDLVILLLGTAVPKSKITKSRRGMRRSHDAIDNDAYVENKDTGELHRPHHIDLKTGMYNGKQILKIKTKN